MSLYELFKVLIGFGSLLITLIALVITLINRK
ncbi:putative holin-like toxin [Virgibacillus necropolis]